jgi:hypothetical protein
MNIDLRSGAEDRLVDGLIQDLQWYGCTPIRVRDRITFDLPSDPTRRVALVGFLPNLLDAHSDVVPPPRISRSRS